MRIVANIPGAGVAEVQIHDERVSALRILGPPDPQKPLLSPSFVDIQVNGFAGVDFSSPDLEPDKAISVLPSLWSTGVATFCPTLLTNSSEALVHALRVLETARRIDARFAQAVPYYHLEGPYLSPDDARGVHDPKLMRPPDWQEFARLQEAAGGRIGIITLAPELPGALEFIRRAREAGTVVAIGHTDATPEQIHQAVAAGAELSTHLGNGCPEFLHRHRTPLWAQLALDQLSASLICDGFHLPPELVKVIVRAKGIERCILITDAIHAATLPPGRYALAGAEVELRPNGQVVKVDDWCLAGSTLTMNRAVAVFMRFAEVSLEDALRAATANPAGLLRSARICARIAEGHPANLVLFRLEPDILQIEALLVQGRAVYLSDDAPDLWPHIPKSSETNHPKS
jgi:N-acetylglucosamine-6-phosphate deacetylase